MTRGLLHMRAYAELVRTDIAFQRRFSALSTLVKRTPVDTSKPPRLEAEEIVEAVHASAAFYFRQIYCLHRAVSVTRMLRRFGHPATVVIGYRPSPVESHAWVELHGRVVSEGRSDLKQYRPLDRW